MRSIRFLVPAVPVLLTLVLGTLSSCGRDTKTLQPAPPNDDPVVFDDTFGDGVDYQAFANSKVDAVSIVTNEKYAGEASMRVEVPAPGHPTDWFAGGAFTVGLARDLSRYNALTFWAKASKESFLDVAGLGNDNTGTSKYEAKVQALPLTTDWAMFTIPVPVPEKLSNERGLFFFAEGGENDEGHEIWFDEVRFDSVTTITNPRPRMISRAQTAIVGQSVEISDTQTIFDVNGQGMVVEHSPGYFTFFSSDDNVVSVNGEQILVVGPGSAEITAQLGSLAAAGKVTVTAIQPPASPAPTPALPAADVISLFSLAYTNVPVDTWSADWDAADVTDILVQNDDIKAYTNLVFAGIEFTSNTVDASAMTHFHMDLWVPEGDTFKIKLVDFGADGAYAGGDDSEHEITLGEGSAPPVTTGSWIGIDVPLSEFTGLTARAHLAQLIISGNTETAFVDNVYFHK